MTVENIKNKMEPMQMGITAEFPFNFAVLLQDPTEEEALKAIKAKVVLANSEEIELVYNVDYTVQLNTDRLGGTLTVNDIKTTGDYITIYRQYEQTQEVDYRDFNSAPAETFEQCFDKLTMLSQQQQEEINRSLKFSISSTATKPSLPEPIASNTLIWNEEGTDLKNYDIIGENERFKANVNNAVEQGQANIQSQLNTFEANQTQELEQFKTEQTTAFEDYKKDINADIETVLDAAERVEKLEGSVADAIVAAEQASEAAEKATTSANNAQNAADEAIEALGTTANKDLTNLSEEGNNKFVKTTELVEIDLNTKANTDLSNLSETGKKVIDGQWVPTYYQLLLNTTMTANTDVVCDLSEIIPNDGFVYEVILSAEAKTLATTNSICNIHVWSKRNDTDDYSFLGVLARGTTKTNGEVYAGGTVILPIFPASKKITLIQASSANCVMGNLRLTGYRRLGTNS